MSEKIIHRATFTVKWTRNGTTFTVKWTRNGKGNGHRHGQETDKERTWNEELLLSI